MDQGRIKHLKAHSVDWPMLVRDLYIRCHERHITMYRAANEMGVNSTSLSALRRGVPLSPNALAALVAWLYPDDIPKWISPAPSER